MVVGAKAEDPRIWWVSHPRVKFQRDSLGTRTWLCGWCYHTGPGFLSYRVSIHRLLANYRAQLTRGHEELRDPICTPNEENCTPRWRRPRNTHNCRSWKPKIGSNGKGYSKQRFKENNGLIFRYFNA